MTETEVVVQLSWIAKAAWGIFWLVCFDTMTGAILTALEEINKEKK